MMSGQYIPPYANEIMVFYDIEVDCGDVSSVDITNIHINGLDTNEYLYSHLKKTHNYQWVCEIADKVRKEIEDFNDYMSEVRHG